jgi:hypothetical protein
MKSTRSRRMKFRLKRPRKR